MFKMTFVLSNGEKIICNCSSIESLCDYLNFHMENFQAIITTVYINSIDVNKELEK